MDIVKKNLISIVCGLVAVIAIIVLFWPTGDYQSKLQADLDTRKGVFTSLSQLQNRQRNLPIVVPGQSEPVPLNRFPSEPVIAAGKAAQQKVQSQSQQMLKDAVAINKQDLLVPDSLPSPRVTDQFRFTEEYVRKLNLRQDPSNTDCIQVQILNGVQPLTQDQLKRASDQLWDSKYKPQVATYSNNQSNKNEVEAEFKEATEKLPEQLMHQAAASHKVYVEADAMDFDQAVQKAAFNGQPASAVDMWYAQMGLWIETDVAKAIATANASSNSILTSPVKRLIKITLPRADKGFYIMDVSQSGNRGNNQTPPPPVAPGTLVAAASPSGRVSNTLYDVVHFEMSVDVEADMIPVFLKDLTGDQFIYVNELNLSKVDSIAMQRQGYLYGDKPVARLDLKCEMLFLRDWTAPLMPPEIKQYLGVQPPQTAGL